MEKEVGKNKQRHTRTHSPIPLGNTPTPARAPEASAHSLPTSIPVWTSGETVSEPISSVEPVVEAPAAVVVAVVVAAEAVIVAVVTVAVVDSGMALQG